ncbi:hypothetical protein D3C76_1198870 [compost metagenome]
MCMEIASGSWLMAISGLRPSAISIPVDAPPPPAKLSTTISSNRLKVWRQIEATCDLRMEYLLLGVLASGALIGVTVSAGSQLTAAQRAVVEVMRQRVRQGVAPMGHG